MNVRAPQRLSLKLGAPRCQYARSVGDSMKVRFNGKSARLASLEVEMNAL